MIRKHLIYGCWLLINTAKSFIFTSQYHFVPFKINSRTFLHNSFVVHGDEKKNYIDAEIINEDYTYKRHDKATVVDTSTEQANEDKSLQESVRDRLERNPEIIQALGAMIRCSVPFSASSSSSNVSGVINKRLSCMMQVEGDNGSGTAQIEASNDDRDSNKMKINTLVIRLFNGRVIKVGENDRGRTGGGGGPGKSDNYIDAEFVSKS